MSEDIASLILKIDASLAEIAALAMDKMTASGAKAEAAMTSLGASGKTALGGLTGIPASLQQIEARTETLRGAVDPLYNVQKKLNGELAEAQRLYNAGAIGADEYARASNMLTQRLQAAGKAQDALNAMHAKGGKAAGLQAHELTNLGRQFADIFTQLGSGQSPMMVLIQQGPQIADVFAQASARGVGFKAALAGVAEMIGPFLGLAAAVVGVGGAFAVVTASAWEAEKAHEAASFAILGAGRASGMTADEVLRLADAQAKAADVSVSGARATANELLSLGVVNQDVMSRAISVQRDFALVMGVDSKDAAQQLAAALADPAKGIEDLDRKLNLFDDTTKRYLLNLARQNDLTGAQRGLLAALEGQIGSATDRVNGLAAAWHSVTTWASNAFAAMGQKMAGPAADVQLAEIDKRLAAAQRGGVFGVNRSAVNNLQQQRDTIRAGMVGGNLTADLAKDQAEYNRQTKYYGDLVRGLNPVESQRKNILQDMADTRKGMAAGFIKEAEGAKALAYAGVQLKALDKREAAPSGKVDPSIRRAENLAREAEAVKATIAGNWDLAAAYGVSDAAAMKQIATTKAISQAIQKQGDIDAFVARQLQVNVSEQAVTGAKRLSDMKAETSIQDALNQRVAAGQITTTEANRLAKEEMALRPLNAAYALAEGQAKADLKAIIDQLVAAQKAANVTQAETINLRAIEQQGQSLEFLKAQLGLIGANNTQRAIELAQLREKQAIMVDKPKGYVLTESDNKRITGAGDVAASQAALAIGQDLYNKSLDYTYDRLTQIDDLVSNSTAGLAEAFDGMSDGAAKFTRALGGVLGAVNKLAIAEEKARKERKQASKDLEEGVAAGKLLNDQETITKARLNYAEISKKTTREIEDAQLSAYANMAGAAKGFFEEGSTGYKVLQTAETAFRAVQFALSLQAMAQDATETGASIGNSLLRAGASVIAGAANFFAQSGWGGFAGVAAMAAVMGGLGYAVMSGGGAKSDKAINAEELQKAQGAGSVLGDSSAKSESIANSLELVAEHTNDMLEYNNQMLRALRGIENNIGAVADAVSRALGLGGALDTPEGLGTKTKNNKQDFGGFMPDLLGLHDATTTKKLVNQGLQFTGQTIADIVSGGIDANFFQTIETRIQKKAFGFTYSDKLKNKTTTTAVDDDLGRQLQLIVGGLRDGVLAAAGVLGIEGAGAVLDAFKLNIGEISFKGMKSDEISAALEAVFSKVGDDMAGAVIPGLSEFQKAGEGLFETLIRVARQYQVIDVTLASVGLTFGAVGLSSLAARERLVDLFGSLDDFTDQVSFYSENFLTEAERLAPVQAALTTELARLGITGLDTRDEFKALVQGLDLSSAAGAELFAALMAIAPAFAAITEETQAMADQRDRLSTAYERESSALADTKAQFQDLFKSLGSFKSSLYTGPSAALSPEAQYNASKGEFERIRGLALTGDVNALGDLQSVSQEYLDASRAYFASSQGYFADLEAVRSAVTAAEGIAGAQVDVAQQQLDALLNLVDPILNIRDDIGTVAAEMQRLNQLLGATTTNTPVVVGGISAGAVANDNTQVVTAIEQTNANLNTLIETTNAAMSQQAAIHNENRVAQQQQITVLQRQVQEMQENRA